jgi:hypothetical protein
VGVKCLLDKTLLMATHVGQGEMDSRFGHNIIFYPNTVSKIILISPQNDLFSK